VTHEVRVSRWELAGAPPRAAAVAARLGAGAECAWARPRALAALGLSAWALKLLVAGASARAAAGDDAEDAAAWAAVLARAAKAR